MKHILYIIGVLCCIVATASAQTVSEADARSKAQAWFVQHDAPTATSTLRGHLRLCRETPRAFLFAQGSRFVLIASSETEPEVLGYGTVADSENLPLPLEAMLGHSAASRAVYPPPGSSWKAVQPLLTTVRHQKAPYNNACPYYLHSDGTLSTTRCVVGCVATAMEQILTYYRREYVLQDTLHGWSSEHYDIPDVLPGERVDTRLVLDDYDNVPATAEEIDAVARLSYWLGVACRMNWGVGESGASTVRLVEPLQRAFGLKYVHYLDSYQYAPEAYWNFIAAEIMQGRPVYYAGSLMRTGGHAFVLDGLDDKGMFHVNWGYGGDFDGYFRLDVLAHFQPEDERWDEFVENGFFCNQEAIAVCPDSVPGICPPDTLERTGREIRVLGAWTMQQPVTGCHTQLMLDVRNESDQALTTPFALVLGSETDTARYEQGDWLAFTGRTLEAGERDTLSVHLQFKRSGRLWLYITPDGVLTLDSLQLDIAQGGTAAIETGEPQVEFPATGTARLLIPLSNPSATDRAAQSFEYDLLDVASCDSCIKQHWIYLEPAATVTDTVQFTSLVPGRHYKLRVRRRWPIVQTLDFTMPVPEGIDDARLPDEALPEAWYTLEGRRIRRPLAPGVYLKRVGLRTEKIIITRN